MNEINIDLRSVWVTKVNARRLVNECLENYKKALKLSDELEELYAQLQDKLEEVRK